MGRGGIEARNTICNNPTTQSCIFREAIVATAGSASTGCVRRTETIDTLTIGRCPISFHCKK